MRHFSDKIINWYLQNKRNLPWRNTQDPYFIWLSEIILQQTRVDQGMSYYLKFAAEFPTVNHLANADNDKVMKLWQGLGYYSRARNLHAAAKVIAEKYNGKFPDNYEEIKSLKGVGDYTAAAIASFAFNKPHAVVDGNVFRVLARVFGLETPIDSTSGKKEFNQLANKLLDKKNPGLYNQSIMEFGAIQCKPVSPDCAACPLNPMCYAFCKGNVSKLPVKSKKTKIRNRYFNYLVLQNEKSVVMHKRGEGDIWANLYEFPLIETEKEFSEDELLNSNEWKRIMTQVKKYSINAVTVAKKHVLSHQNIYARFLNIKSTGSFSKLSSMGYIVLPKDQLNNVAVSRLIENYIITIRKSQ